ncbi:MAG: sodium:proton antiporter NhaD [Candidatus Symbiothrix sp.]|jgi:Na+/H+ antiporter NhaD/arsenite permease-like protein|nr:sodium:proton antiporter NhaD [Candidatus Symbiothrix sp.]
MFTLMIVVFVIGYACIALEHPIGINKSATALLLGTLMWVLGVNYMPEAHNSLVEHLGEVAEILFFLMGAMTIVEIVDVHEGFRIITDRISTTKKSTLIWVISLITFFMSAVLDNLTTSIVMVALLRKLIDNRQDRWMFASMVILAANAGGAWSPIGDVTTIMLWIAGKFSSEHIIAVTIVSSIVSLIVPLAVLSFMMKGNVSRPAVAEQNTHRYVIQPHERKLIFCLGVGALLFVPVFKTITHLPPYLGMLGGLAMLWIVTGFLHKRRPESDTNFLSVNNILGRIDTPSILFFLGILMAVNALQTCGHLAILSASLDKIPLGEPNKYYLITVIIGALSSIVDNVPLVAAAMGMYDFPMNHYFWEFLAYAAGTGGSILIIGSAAGVAVMGMEKIDFIWYLKRISWLALLGYLAGALTYIVQQAIFR